MTRRPTGARRPTPPPDIDETREHIMAAGHELLLAAGGALRFCRSYVETSVPEASRANLLSFFQKAIAVADELSRGIAGVSTITKAAGTVAKPLFTAMGQEMQAQQAAARAASTAAPKEKPCPRSTRRSSSATRTASSTTRRTRATSRSRTSAR